MKNTFSFALRPAMTLAFVAALVTAYAAPAKTGSPSKTPPQQELHADITINPEELAPESTIEVVFPTAMVAKDQIGKTAAASPLIVVPELTGTFEWTSTRSGHFHLTQAPKFASSYDFKLRAGLTDLAGKPLSAEKLDSVNSARFLIVDQHPRWFDDDAQNRSPRFLFEFNDSVVPAEAAKHIKFVSESSPQPVAARVRHATGKDFNRMSADPQATWAEQISKAKPAVADDAARLSALIVEPEAQLSIGKWRLVIAPTLSNASGANQIAAGNEVQLGEIKPFEVREVEAHTPFDSDYYIDVDFNKRLLPPSNDEMTKEMVDAFAQKLAPFVTIRRTSLGQKLAAVVNKDEGPMTGLKVEILGSTLRFSGPFEVNKKYSVAVAMAMTSGDNLPLQANYKNEVTFIPNPPYLAAPSFLNAQLAKGDGNYEFSAANVSQVRVRAKRLNGPELLKTLDQYRAYRSAYYGNDKQKAAYKMQSIETYPGTQVFDRSFPVNKPLDHSEILKLNWREVLGDFAAAPLFIELEGTAAAGLTQKGVVTQTLVQFTDLGIMQKSNGRETMIFVTSLETGKPVSGVRLTLVDSDLKLIGYGDTDASGIATAPGASPSFVLAEKNGDCAVIECSDSSVGVPYDISRSYEDVWQPQRRTFVFSDRPLYKPGDAAHFKAHTRLLTGDDLSLDPAPVQGRLVVRDPRYRIVIDKPVTFTANGAWADDVVLPTGPAGWYDLSINLKAANPNSQSNDGGGMTFRIDDYKPNTFEVKLDTKALKFQPDRIHLPLSANYYMGKALSVAKVQWSASSQRDYEAPEAYRRYHFGEADKWSHYGQDRDADGDYEGGSTDETDNEWFLNGNLFLADDGTATLEMPQPPPDRAALPQRVRVNAEVTDINEQTISAATEFEVPGADFLLGLKGPEYFGTAGKAMQLEVVAIDSKGAPAAGNVHVDLRVERQEYHTLKIATAGGGSTTKDQVVLREELKQSLDLKAATAGSAPSTTVAFTPAAGGVYFVTAEAVDAKGTKVLSRMPFYAIGGKEFPWAMEDGNRMNLQPEKTRLKPGEDAVIVVKTPIAGTALVTLERNKLHRQFVTELTLENPIIRVPLGEDEFPNVFVSVIVIRGSAASTRQHKMPEYRVGYCALTVESDAKELKLAVKPDREEVRPAEAVNITTTITDAKGTAVSGADVTLYAVDEGVLSLMKHETPDPSAFFHSELPLAIDSFTSFDSLLSEEAGARDRGNKGFVVGGGDGDGNGPEMNLRKNFVVTPLWLASGTTDAQGRLSTSVTAPDNLTRYRIMAVAAHGADRFGSGESAFKINKPLMVDPAVPRFARLGDEFLVKAVVHNTTPNAGAVEVTLELDGTANFIQDKRDFIPASLKADAGGSAKLQKVILQIKAGETAATAFPVQFVQLGTAKWKWTARGVDWPSAASDGTESVFEVNHPVPELKYVKYTRLKADEPQENLIKDVNPALLEGEGSLSLGISNSRLYEARDALDYLLHYPYGCVEQTTSATMPWLALGKYEPLFPDQLGGGRTAKVVQAGVDKLLQMTTDEGGLAYWAGGTESSLWGSAYGGLLLLRARDQGANVPEDAVNKLVEYLSKKLRGLEEEKDLYNITDSALALYTLAKAGKPEPAYQNLLFGRREHLPETARLYLALSMCLSNAPEQQIKDTLGWKPAAPPAPPKADSKAKVATSKKKTDTKTKSKAKTAAPAAPAAPRPVVWSHWAGNGANKALRLICYTHLGLTEDAEHLAVSILQSRNGRGEWGNTFTNAWTLTALAAYERSLKKVGEPLTATGHWDTQAVPLTLGAGFASTHVNFALNQALSARPLSVELPAGREIYGRIEARSYPPQRDFAGENKGYAIERSYEKLNMDGSTSGTEDLRVGDMVVVTLKIEIGGGDRYLAIDDALPAVFEAVNPEFGTQSEREGDQLPDGTQQWFCDHREIRTDRALFFTDFAPAKGKFSLQYLARVIAEGDTVAPPARIEAMYQPDKYGLSPTLRVRTLPSAGAKVAGK
ncbi:alpha-2-macroglobulin family protein [Prosthecobacter sp.]|uniref:alpha-2-macroglobulin family protein n=1 Tax=Prosthecobacter sp. TaxID=1965333 RepID=UPI003782DA41